MNNLYTVHDRVFFDMGASAALNGSPMPKSVVEHGVSAVSAWRSGNQIQLRDIEMTKNAEEKQNEKLQQEADELTAAIILDRAKHIVTGQRQTTHGRPERSFEHIAARWSLTLGVKVTPFQVALMMADMKLTRAIEGVTTGAGEDHLVDAVGYVALAGEMTHKR